MGTCYSNYWLGKLQPCGEVPVQATTSASSLPCQVAVVPWLVSETEGPDRNRVNWLMASEGF